MNTPLNAPFDPNASTLGGHADEKLLRMRRLGIDTYQEPVVYMHSNCHICKSEGFEAQSRVEVHYGAKHVVATLNVVHGPMLAVHDVGLSEAAWRALDGHDGAPVRVQHPQPLLSFSSVRAKIYGTPLNDKSARSIITDIIAGHFSEIELASLITACSGGRMDVDETIALTRAMVEAGQRLHWPASQVLDKHCVGGLPGNRTTMLVVPIVAACGLTIPKTSSRAITSPAGTADAMETIAPVSLGLDDMRRVVEQESGCVVWGGAVSLSPADDLLIRVERPLGLDSDGLLAASVLSKKIAAGSTDVMIDIPVGPTAKLRSTGAAYALAGRLIETGEALGIRVRTMISDGSQPVGRGIGPALEAHDVLAVLQNLPGAPADLRARALTLAGDILEMGGLAAPGTGQVLAASTLDSGAAWRKFQAICKAQGGMREPPVAPHTGVLTAAASGTVTSVDNRRLAAIAKLAGAPKAASAGVVFSTPIGTRIARGEPWLTIHAESPGELAYATAYAESQAGILVIAEDA